METKSPFIVLLLFFISTHIHSQIIPKGSPSKDSLELAEIEYVDIDDDIDSTEMPVFMLREVMVINRPELKTWEERKAYYILRRRTKKVYPYAVLAGKRLSELDIRLETLSSRRKKKKYIKKVQKYIEDEFGPTLKKFTQSEGRILIKLIYRQTGVNTYDIIRKYKSGWSAFWTNTTAKVFNLSLKATYNPFQNSDDLKIEAILIDSFEKGYLKPESPFWDDLDPMDSFFDPLPKEEE
ncbi:MAG: DUF4294 domain-containing protein [Flavobacteriales bacterium]|nr:DUF4294 domain-containing protein [Flavobacteriales bacterium]